MNALTMVSLTIAFFVLGGGLILGINHRIVCFFNHCVVCFFKPSHRLSPVRIFEVVFLITIMRYSRYYSKCLFFRSRDKSEGNHLLIPFKMYKSVISYRLQIELTVYVP